MVDESNHNVGVLTGLDIAARIRDDARNNLPIPADLPNGSLPFRTIDLLEWGDTFSRPLYRHDLESFVYVLAWITEYYREGIHRPSNALSAWHTGRFGQMSDAKSIYMSRRPQENDSPLALDWLPALRLCFKHGYQMKWDALEYTPRAGKLVAVLAESFQDEDLDGHITFVKAIAILQVLD